MKNNFIILFIIINIAIYFVSCEKKEEKKEDVKIEDVTDIKKIEIEEDIGFEDKKEVEKKEEIELLEIFDEDITIVDEKKEEDVQLKDLSCKEIGFYVAECLLENPPGIDCVEFYKEKGTDEGKTKFSSFWKCFEEKKCEKFFEGDYFSECVEENCLQERLSCFSGQDKCFDIYKCRKACPANELFCPQKCMSEGTPQAQQYWVKFSKCIIDAAKGEREKCKYLPNGWPDENCEKWVITKCPNDAKFCQPF